MKLKSLLSVLFFSTIFISKILSINIPGNIIAPYQVIIRWVQTEPNAPVINLCNGVIVSKDYILTTALCLHAPAPWAPYEPSKMITLSSSQLYVVAGNFTMNSNDHGVKRNVISVIIHDQFNAMNSTNDVALLKLDRSLPLDGGPLSSINWIELQQVPTYTNCYLVPLVNMESTTYPYYKKPNATVSDYWICNQTELPDENFSFGKMCLQYTTRNIFLCNTNDTRLRFSVERGTSMICDERISGLLAQIHRPLNPKFCETTGTTFATYTNISEYSDWIRTEAALYFYNSNSSVANDTSSLMPPSWTNLTNTGRKPNNSHSVHASVMSILLGLIATAAVQISFDYFGIA